ncbi:MAG TPA: hypothetical protein VIK59_02960 [Verrucomicrobiae bacterium]
MKTILFIYALTCITVCAQTNYPPNSPPFNNHPTNWVYSCEFGGYNNQNPNVSYLPCGWYDQPTNLVSNGSANYFNPGPLTLKISFINLELVRGFPGYLIGFEIDNSVVGSSYEVQSSYTLKSPSWTTVATVVSTSRNFTFNTFFPFSTNMFFRCYGVAPEYFGGVYLNEPSHFHAVTISTFGLGLAFALSRIFRV